MLIHVYQKINKVIDIKHVLEEKEDNKFSVKSSSHLLKAYSIIKI